MKYSLLRICVIVCLSVGWTDCQTEFSSLLHNINRNVFSLIQSTDNQQNVLISPLSIGMAVSMLYHGTSGNSRRQLRNAFSLPDPDILKAQASEIMRTTATLDKSDLIKIRTGNGIFLNGFTPKPRFVNTLEANYDAEVVNLKENTNKVQIVNEWIKGKTEGLIPNFLSDGSIAADTKMLLVNAIYFYGQWLYPFEKRLTTLQRFYTDDKPKQYVVTEFMDLEETLELVDQPGKMKAIFLPYQHKDYTMIIILPHQNISIQQLGDELFEMENMKKLVGSGRTTKVNLQMPKFDIFSENSLVEPLERMNVTDIFDDFAADLSRISDQKITVGDILHSANIKVNEEGSEAAAVSSVNIHIRTSVKGPLELIRLNRPFLFSIVDGSGTPLFTGKIVNPTKKRPILDNDEPKLSDISDDTILAVRKPELEELAARRTEDQTPSVNIKCPMGASKVKLEEFNTCESTCEAGQPYGLCIFGCWSRFCS